MGNDPTVLIWTPIGRDGPVIQRLLGGVGIPSRPCSGFDDLLHGLDGAAGAVIAQEGLLGADLAAIEQWVKAQPSWSDFPFVLLSHRGSMVDRRLIALLGNVTVIERPVDQTTLVSAVSSARRARLRQFEAGKQLAEQQRMRRALAEETRTLGILNELGATLSAELDLERVVQAVTDAGVALTGAEFGAFFYNVIDEKGESYTLYTLSGAPRSKFETFPMPRNTAVFAPTFSGEGVVRSGDITRDPRYGRNAPYAGMPEGHLPVRSYLAVPVTSRSGEVLGGLFFGHSTPDMFGEAAERIMVGVSGQAATAIDNVRLFLAEQRELEERRRAEAELKRQRDEFLTLADNISSLCWLAYGDGTIFWYNKRWYEFAGGSPEDGVAWESAHDPQAAPEIRERWQHALRTGERFEMIFPMRRHDGAVREFLCRITPIRDETGSIFRWCGTHADITEQREVEAALEARVAERTSDLQRALTRLEEEAAEREKVEEALRQSQKMEAIGQLTGGVAHDFNNLLTVIMSGVDALRRPGLSEERRSRYVNAIAETAERAAKLTAQLLAFARRQPLREIVFDAADNVGRIVEMLATVVGSRITLDTDFRLSPAPVKADLIQFETALVNMAVNARDAMDGEGSILLRVDASDEIPPIPGHPAVAGAFIAVSITDSGVGLAADQIARIFEPFYTTKAVGKGTGLGLSQVYGFAKQSGGDVRVDSAPGEGATFTLYLPRAAEAELMPEAEPQAETIDGDGSGRILVVEDNENVGEHASQLLCDLGYETVRVQDARSALQALQEASEPFDLVLSDIVMPGGMSGLELARTLARMHPELPVVLTTGYSDVLIEEGSDDVEVLRKPYSMDALGALMRRLINKVERGR
ncbi:ATP-binding protein [Sphingomonas cannabina]|uniref:GAF domain-containing hybrid sensor histidine kinase/response regulator n=1 Tax=Sphingomonas cannabina TaxID=2899123 RepID=UPI001F2F3A6D|nr:ATP-binding protein [Sphingomonas cannabina]UIJ44191.1 ATP-binding protein [Sphingomonas cannabina]